MDDSPSACRGRRDELRIGQPRDQRFLTEDVKIGVQRMFDKRCMAAWWCADVHEIEYFARQEVGHAFVPASAMTVLEKGFATGRKHIGCSHDHDVLTRTPPGQVALRRDIPEPD